MTQAALESDLISKLKTCRDEGVPLHTVYALAAKLWGRVRCNCIPAAMALFEEGVRLKDIAYQLQISEATAARYTRDARKRKRAEDNIVIAKLSIPTAEAARMTGLTMRSIQLHRAKLRSKR